MAKTLGFLANIEADLSRVEMELHRCIADVAEPVLAEASGQLLLAGGKRLRPAFALLTGRLANGEQNGLVPLAVALELIHMATLVHDDVVDEAATRRGLPTVRARWGDSVSLHAGDYLFAKSLLLISCYDDPRIATVLAQVSVRMCEGELQQMNSAYDVAQGMRDYLARVKAKTAFLISASCALGAVAAKADTKMVRSLGAYGYYLGMAFQVTDDILDMVATEEELGKPVASDLRQGILTLPTIRALQVSPQREKLANLIAGRNLGDEAVQYALEVIRNCDGLDYSRRVVAWYVEKAKQRLAGLPDEWPLQALLSIADFVGSRRF